ncbi:2-oxo-4-hydroxy-4-carboxy-5-ureidoimidazoline decarboxylase [Streptomyces brasiliensis]|uniref:2-oxo-4-hydroxy-4-carboxy-5-ureidoimidazoline decarboxylase n=1 Tax=Streptomyces brasiliensis TaxID=1954 RepID=A0A917NRE2_9ACTN|nr:2-oxo-4-hydroxy-4-carboxy-5-ureidoimidazoline decarboxylase [Streptomyces brasiliensis]GGJ20774.1 2-oxo-4-hydroxy-4-carboxy-5-ureidoimidazoline decarboxylase [Streptomyces brasiliensis]
MTRGPTLPAPRLPYAPGRAAISALPRQTRASLQEFNTAPVDQALTTLLTCLHSHRWAHRVAAHRPYPDLDSLLAAADEAAYDLTAGDLTEALAGETLPTLPDGTYSVAHTALNAAHAAYEARFGHAFVIYLGDTAPEETLDRVLEGIRARLTNDREEERVVASDQLRKLAGNRLVTYLRGAGQHRSAAPPRGATSPNGAASGISRQPPPHWRPN